MNSKQRQNSFRMFGSCENVFFIHKRRCAKGDSTKLKPFVLLDRKRPITALEAFKPHLHLVYVGKTWMDDELTKQFLMNIIRGSLFSRKLLIWDSFRSHISESSKEICKKLKVDMAVVPGGCTKYMQAPDVVWNKPFKAKICELYDDWQKSGDFELTKGGNVKAPNIELVCQWIEKAWDDILIDVIAKSFKNCAITNALDGSEDDLISCFKPGNDCAARLELLKMKEAELQNSMEQVVEIDDEEEDLNNTVCHLVTMCPVQKMK